MYCRSCGAQIPNDARFCNKCGVETKPLPGQPAHGNAPAASTARGPVGQTASIPQAVSAAQAGSAAHAQATAPAAKRKRKRTGLVVGAVAAVLIVAIGVGIGVWWKFDQDAKAAAAAEWERTHVTLVTHVKADAPGFDDAATPIPVQVRGTDLDGNAVDEVQYLHPDNMQITTLQGSYDIDIPCGYISGSGGVTKPKTVHQHMERWLEDNTGDTGSNTGSNTDAGEARDRKGPSDGDNPNNTNENGGAGDTGDNGGNGDTDGNAGDTGDNGGNDGNEGAETNEGGTEEGGTDTSTDNNADASAENTDSGDAGEPEGAGSSGESAGSSDSAASAESGQDQQNGAEADDTIEIAFEEVPVLDVTDAMLSDIREWASKDERDGGKAENLSNIARENHERAVEEEAERQRAQELMDEAFGSFPRDFTFTSGVGGWSTDITIQPDGTFSGSWHDSDMGARGPGYRAQMAYCNFEGKFTVLEKLSDTDFLMQIDYLRPTEAPGEEIRTMNGTPILYKCYDDKPYGLGEMTETPVGGWHLYLPGQNVSVFSDEVRTWLTYPLKKSGSTLNFHALANNDLGYGWSSLD